MEALSTSSRRNESVVDYLSARFDPKLVYDAFLCHNSEDKAAVRALSSRLIARGIRTWFDEVDLRPGFPWQQALEEQISSIGSAIVCVGASGLGPWQDVEHRAFLAEFVSRSCPVIPLILPDAGQIPVLPLFLRAFTWVDMRGSHPDPFERLIYGITGRRNV
jgi:nucleotide-binding universal stress UspA family protein